MAKHLAKKQLGKKGIFLTFIAISLIAAFILIFLPSGISLRKDIPVINTRVTTINEYVVDLENVYLERALQSAGTKTTIALIKYMQSRNRFLANFEDSFKEVLLQGTIDGQPIDSFIEPDIMAGNAYPEWLAKIKATADNAFNINTNFSAIAANDIRVYQTSPWLLTVDANISFTVSSETASWNKSIVVRSGIDIQNFNDPYYLINTQGLYSNRINKSSVSFDEWDINKVKDHIRHGTYVHFERSKAPNFIMRFTNTSLNSGCCGIESAVNPSKPAIGDKMESYADYLFFNHTYQNRCTELYNITEPSFKSEFPHFKLDFEHLVLYNLTTGAIRAC